MAPTIADHDASAILMSSFKTPGDAASSQDIMKALTEKWLVQIINYIKNSYLLYF